MELAVVNADGKKGKGIAVSEQTFGAKFNVVTAKIDAAAKAKLFLKEIAAPPRHGSAVC